MLAATIGIWDASSGQCLQILEDCSDPVTSVAFSHDSTCLASGSNDNTVKLYNGSNGECLQIPEVGKVLVQMLFDITCSSFTLKLVLSLLVYIDFVYYTNCIRASEPSISSRGFRFRCSMDHI